jgi:hypothetical protein
MEQDIFGNETIRSWFNRELKEQFKILGWKVCTLKGEIRLKNIYNSYVIIINKKLIEVGFWNNSANKHFRFTPICKFKTDKFYNSFYQQFIKNLVVESHWDFDRVLEEFNKINY